MAEGKVVEGQANPKPTEDGQPADDTVTLRRGEVEGYRTQIKQLRSSQAELEKRLSEFDAAKAKEEKERLRAASEFDALGKKLEAERDQMAAEVARLKRSTIVERARAALVVNGMRAGLAIEGAVASLPTEFDEADLGDWVAKIREAHPGEFGKPDNPIAAPSVGAAGRPPADDGERLKTEWQAARAKGPDAMMAVKRKVDVYIAKTGKNPLA